MWVVICYHGICCVHFTIFYHYHPLSIIVILFPLDTILVLVPRADRSHTIPQTKVFVVTGSSDQRIYNKALGQRDFVGPDNCSILDVIV